ncbi:ectonucleotide pyrophosphatase/phosphodiesterase family member 5-like isoform X1 [Lineus longissimus]|uniref:ectonucleotide pyrophosphatase/phosphodiesterase family member 5-like isoform X1 n=1 Tax=Lineus longissimus TaxID=88925 RepID=UPI00315D7774
MLFLRDILHCIVLLNISVIFSLAHFEHKEDPKVLLISFDGFRWDYLDRVGPAKAPNFFSLIKDGVKAKSVVNTFTTKTFPNHFTIVTGLWEESHGIVDNDMYDPKFNRTFTKARVSDMKDSFWWDNGAIPIWIANEQEDEKRRSGTIYWAGSQSTYTFKGHKLKQFVDFGDYNFDTPYKKIVDTMVEWFSQESRPINFGAMYFDMPDALAHRVGPSSPKIDEMITTLDKNVTGYLIEELKKHNLFDVLNIIITSDHGFVDTSKDRVIDVSKYVDSNLYTKYGKTSVWNILPKSGHEDEVYKGFKKFHHLTVYKKDEIPKNYHYSKNERILPIVVVADEGWILSVKGNPFDEWNTTKGGGHGYNNSLESMHPFFIAHGPAFKQDYQRGPLNIVDIYSLMAEVLKLSPGNLGPHNGSTSNIMDMLRSENHTYDMTTTFVTFIMVIVMASLITGIFSIVVIRQQRVHATRRFRLLTDGLMNESAQPMMLQSDEEL